MSEVRPEFIQKKYSRDAPNLGGRRKYLAWLTAGKPTKYFKSKQEREAELVERTDCRVTREHEILLERKFLHKGLTLIMFEKHFEESFQQFMKRGHLLTSFIYKELARKPIEGD